MPRIPSIYAHQIGKLSARIFNKHLPETLKQTIKIDHWLANEAYYKKYRFANYYPPLKDTGDLMSKLREYGLYVDEHKDFNEEMEKGRVLRGKGKKQRFKNQ